MRNTILIHAVKLRNVGPSRSIHLTTEAGSIPAGRNKDGSERIDTFGVDVFILIDEKHGVLCGPTDVGGALDLATAIITGNARAVTEPQALLVLATAVAGLCTPSTVMPPEAPSSPARPFEPISAAEEMAAMQAKTAITQAKVDAFRAKEVH